MLPNYDFENCLCDFHKLAIGIHYKYNIDTVALTDALLSFASKDEYFEWVNHWKTHYKSLVERQKELKKEIHKPHILQHLHSDYGWYWVSSAASFQSKIAKNKIVLTTLLYLRAEGKKRSWKMKQEQV